MANLNTFVLTGFKMLGLQSTDGKNWRDIEIEGSFKSMALMDSASSPDGVVLIVGPNPEWAKDRRRILYASGSLRNFEAKGFDHKVQALSRNGRMLDSGKRKKQDGLHRLEAVAYGNNRFVATGGQAAHGRKVYTTSKNGRVWSDMYYWHSWEFGQVRTLIHGGDRFLGLGDFKRISTTRDGENWEFNREADRPAWLSAAYGNERFVAGGLHGLHGVSRDGLNWTDLEEGEIGQHLNSMNFANGTFVGLGTQVVAFSPDGQSWRIEKIQPRLRAAAYGNGVFIGYDVAANKLYRSTDALKWEEVELKLDNPRFTSIRFI
ncbi:MAG: hypothetical protein ACFBZ8_03935 [Opitutales bacterium]